LQDEWRDRNTGPSSANANRRAARTETYLTSPDTEPDFDKWETIVSIKLSQ